MSSGALNPRIPFWNRLLGRTNNDPKANALMASVQNPATTAAIVNDQVSRLPVYIPSQASPEPQEPNDQDKVKRDINKPVEPQVDPQIFDFIKDLEQKENLDYSEAVKRYQDLNLAPNALSKAIVLLSYDPSKANTVEKLEKIRLSMIREPILNAIANQKIELLSRELDAQPKTVHVAAGESISDILLRASRRENKLPVVLRGILQQFEINPCDLKESVNDLISEDSKPIIEKFNSELNTGTYLIEDSSDSEAQNPELDLVRENLTSVLGMIRDFDSPLLSRPQLGCPFQNKAGESFNTHDLLSKLFTKNKNIGKALAVLKFYLLHPEDAVGNILDPLDSITPDLKTLDVFRTRSLVKLLGHNDDNLGFVSSTSFFQTEPGIQLPDADLREFKLSYKELIQKTIGLKSAINDFVTSTDRTKAESLEYPLLQEEVVSHFRLSGNYQPKLDEVKNKFSELLLAKDFEKMLIDIEHNSQATNKPKFANFKQEVIKAFDGIPQLNKEQAQSIYDRMITETQLEVNVAGFVKRMRKGNYADQCQKYQAEAVEKLQQLAIFEPTDKDIATAFANVFKEKGLIDRRAFLMGGIAATAAAILATLYGVDQINDHYEAKRIAEENARIANREAFLDAPFEISMDALNDPNKLVKYPEELLLDISNFINSYSKVDQEFKEKVRSSFGLDDSCVAPLDLPNKSIIVAGPLARTNLVRVKNEGEKDKYHLDTLITFNDENLKKALLLANLDPTDDELNKAKEYFQNSLPPLLQNTKWVAPLYPVIGKDGMLRFIVEPQTANIVFNRTRIPGEMDDMFDDVDFVSAYQEAFRRNFAIYQLMGGYVDSKDPECIDKAFSLYAKNLGNPNDDTDEELATKKLEALNFVRKSSVRFLNANAQSANIVASNFIKVVKGEELSLITKDDISLGQKYMRPESQEADCLYLDESFNEAISTRLLSITNKLFRKFYPPPPRKTDKDTVA